MITIVAIYILLSLFASMIVYSVSVAAARADRSLRSAAKKRTKAKAKNR